MRESIEDMKVPVIVLPKDLPVAASAAQKRQWENRIKEKRRSKYYFIIWGLVSDVLRHRIQALETSIP